MGGGGGQDEGEAGALGHAVLHRETFQPEGRHVALGAAALPQGGGALK